MAIQLENEEKISDADRELCVLYGSAGSEAMFDFPCKVFRHPDCIGVIPYRLHYNCAIIFGDPICPENELQTLTHAFYKYCDEFHWNVIFITASEKFANWKQNDCKISMEVCKELIFDPQFDINHASHRLQHRIEKAMTHGLTFHEYIPIDKEIEKSLLEIGLKWQKSIKGPQLYLGHLNFFENYDGKRWFYVKDGNQVTSILVLSKLQAQDGWLLKFLMTLPNSFHETSEFLMMSVLKKLRKENCHYLTKGMVPVDSLGEVKGLGYFSTQAVKSVYKVISTLFRFKERKEYWNRYAPKSVPSYLLIHHPKLGLNEIRALIKVFRMSIK